MGKPTDLFDVVMELHDLRGEVRELKEQIEDMQRPLEDIKTGVLDTAKNSGVIGLTLWGVLATLIFIATEIA